MNYIGISIILSIFWYGTGGMITDNCELFLPKTKKQYLIYYILHGPLIIVEFTLIYLAKILQFIYWDDKES